MNKGPLKVTEAADDSEPAEAAGLTPEPVAVEAFWFTA